MHFHLVALSGATMSALHIVFAQRETERERERKRERGRGRGRETERGRDKHIILCFCSKLVGFLCVCVCKHALNYPPCRPQPQKTKPR